MLAVFAKYKCPRTVTVIIAISIFFAPLISDAISFTPQVINQIGFTETSIDERSMGKLVNAVYVYGLGIVGVAAVLVMMYGGLLYIVAAGESAKINSAKQWIFSALTGLVLALFSYTLVYLVNPNLVVMTPLRPASPKLTPAGTAAGGGHSHAEAEKMFNDAGITLGKTNNVSLEGMRKEIISELIGLKTANPNLEMIITSGVEGTHTIREYGHGNGYKADLRLTSSLTSHIQNSPQFTRVGIRSDGAVMYERSGGGCYARESDHWDVKPFKCK